VYYLYPVANYDEEETRLFIEIEKMDVTLLLDAAINYYQKNVA